MEQVGGAVAGVGDRLAVAAQRQQNRRDAIESSRDINAFNTEVNTEIERLTAESDLSLGDVQEQFGAFMSERRNKLLAEHKGSLDSRAALEARLIGMESAFTGGAAAVGTSIARDMVDQAVEQSLGPLTARVRQDPSLANISAAFGDLDTTLGDLSKGFDDPSQEDARRRVGRERLVVTALETLINRGDVETAVALLDDSGLRSDVTESVASSIRQRAAEISRTRDDALRLLEQAEVIKGEPLTQSERLAVIGITPPAEELVEVGDPSSPTGSRFVPASQAAGQPGRPRQSDVNIGSIPPGFQLVRDPSDPNVMRMEAIPGGPADAEAQARTSAEQEQKRQAARKAKIVVRDIDKSLTLIDESILPATGAVGRALDVIPGTAGFQLQRNLDTIRANVGFDQLQAMRAASPTGGALGQVSERENVLLQSVQGSLDIGQNRDVLVENLGQIRELFLDAWFGTPIEHQAAIEDGRMTEAESKALMKERETVGFDAIGRALDPQAAQPARQETTKPTDRQPAAASSKAEDEPPGPATRPTPGATGDLEPEDILAMSAAEIKLLDFPNLTPEQAVAADQRLNELGF